MTNSEKKRLEFSQRALQCLNNQFGLEDDVVGNKELMLSTYMTIFSKLFDDREPLSKSDDELLEIVKTAYRSSSTTPLPKYSNPLCGRPLWNPIDRKALIAIQSSEGESDRYKKLFAKKILTYTRNAIQHGNFDLNDDGTITLWETYHNKPDKKFEITYEFDCLVDICDKLKGKTELLSFEAFLEHLKSNKKETLPLTDDNKLIYFDLFTNTLIAYNSHLAYDENNIYEFNQRYGTALDRSKIAHIRNSSTHSYRTINNDTINVIDYYDSDKTLPSTSGFLIDFNDIINLSKRLSKVKSKQPDENTPVDK